MSGLADNDQSCASSADCYKDCKLCDGYGFGPAGPAGPAGPEDSFCLCQDGTCNKIGKKPRAWVMQSSKNFVGLRVGL